MSFYRVQKHLKFKNIDKNINLESECYPTNDGGTRKRERTCFQFKDGDEIESSACYGDAEESESCPFFDQWSPWLGKG